MAAMTLLSTSGLSHNFGGLHAVSNVDFELPDGQIRALIGPNGAGKTTFVSLLCGRIPAKIGKISFLGKDVTRLPAHKRIASGMAYTFQITSIFARLSVFENIALAINRHSHSHGANLRNEVVETAASVGLADRIDQIAGDLSYGHQRLIEIAMGLGQKPRLLILDEPTQGLADGEIEDFIALIKSIAGKTTILLIEHNMNVVMDTAEYITVMNFGKILAEGKPADIRNNADVQAAYLGTG